MPDFININIFVDVISTTTMMIALPTAVSLFVGRWILRRVARRAGTTRARRRRWLIHIESE